MSIYFGIILCTRIPLCQSSMKQWIVLRLNLKLSLPCSSNYALHLGWNGGALSTKVFTMVCRKHGLQNQDGQVCQWVLFFAKFGAKNHRICAKRA